MLREYDECIPGTAERIIRSFELESEHRRSGDLEAASQHGRYLSAHIWVMKAGLISTTVLAALGLVVAAILAWKGQYIPATAISGGEIVGLTILGFVRRPKHEMQQGSLPPPR